MSNDPVVVTVLSIQFNATSKQHHRLEDLATQEEGCQKQVAQLFLKYLQLPPLSPKSELRILTLFR